MGMLFANSGNRLRDFSARVRAVWLHESESVASNVRFNCLLDLVKGWALPRHPRMRMLPGAGRQKLRKQVQRRRTPPHFGSGVHGCGGWI
jgi:hypothetical protein